jgi:hypothetical protein
MIQDKSLAAKHHTSANRSTKCIKLQGGYFKENSMEQRANAVITEKRKIQSTYYMTILNLINFS